MCLENKLNLVANNLASMYEAIKEQNMLIAENNRLLRETLELPADAPQPDTAPGALKALEYARTIVLNYPEAQAEIERHLADFKVLSIRDLPDSKVDEFMTVLGAVHRYAEDQALKIGGTA